MVVWKITENRERLLMTPFVLVGQKGAFDQKKNRKCFILSNLRFI